MQVRLKKCTKDENKKWKMILGCGIHGIFGTHYSGGGILIYESDNLYSWEYKGVMFKKSLSEGGFYFETPNYCNLLSGVRKKI